MSELSALSKEQARYAERGLTVVRMLASVFAREWPAVHLSDFISIGHEAVVKAALRFDPDRGVPFEQFARHAIWGTMLDVAHRETFIVRESARRIARVMSDAVEVEQFTDSWLDEPTTSGPEEVVANLRARVADLAAVAFAGGTQALTAEDLVIEDQERRLTLTRLRAGLRDLDDKERGFIRMYYEEDATLEEIAKKQGVAKRTVQRLHDRVKAKLAGAMREGREAGAAGAVG